MMQDLQVGSESSLACAASASVGNRPVDERPCNLWMLIGHINLSQENALCITLLYSIVPTPPPTVSTTVPFDLPLFKPEVAAVRTRPASVEAVCACTFFLSP